eukprot:jgi/Chlat1/6011/Chrsp4S06315
MATHSARASFTLRKAYLIAYNAFSCLGWAYVLVAACSAYASHGIGAVYDAIKLPLLTVQSTMSLEIIHAMIGLVPSPIMATLPQVGSRLFVLWAVLYSFPQVRSEPAVLSLVVSWAITEVIRYSFFTMKVTTGDAPRFLLWLRYTTFYVLYVTGISSEVYLIWKALPHIQASKLYSVTLPNKLNFAFDFYIATLGVLAAYVPGSPFLYLYMVSQRSRALKPKSKTA